jgi:hypothetical protein
MSLTEPAISKNAAELRAMADVMRAKADLQMDATVASTYRAMASSYDTMAAHRELADVHASDPMPPDEASVPAPRVPAKRSISRRHGRE